MDSLRTTLSKLSESLPSPPQPSSFPSSQLAQISPTLLAFLHPKALHILSLTTSQTSAISLSTAFESLQPADGLLALTSPTAVSIIDGITPHNMHTPPSPTPVAEQLFASRPGLRLLHAAWSPAAPGFLMLLTSDACLRLYDVVSQRGCEIERWKLQVETNAKPVSFAFGRGSEVLCVYVLTEDGKVYVACPIAPIGTRIPRGVWKRLLDDAVGVLERNGGTVDDNEMNGETKRKLDFTDGEESWAGRQAEMQRRFLEHVFKESGGDMVATKEFKPAPVLFQGPLYVEQDDTEEEGEGFVGLRVLNFGSGKPPVLMRWTKTGEVSVLIVMEGVEMQWFLGGGREEYRKCATAVAPLLLCFEHLSFEGSVDILQWGGRVDSDVVYGITNGGVYGVRLSFVSGLRDAGVLESVGESSVWELLNVGDRGVLGGVAWYVKGVGPVAIVGDGKGGLHVTEALTWVNGIEVGSGGVVKEEVGRRVGISAEEKEVREVLRHLEGVLGEFGGRVVEGTLGMGGDGKLEVLEELERRVEGLTGGDGLGVGDGLRVGADALMAWVGELQGREGFVDMEEVVRSGGEVGRKVGKVKEGNLVLRGRVERLEKKVKMGGLRGVEIERLQRLRETRKRIRALRGRVDELKKAVEARKSREREAERDVGNVRPWGMSPSRSPVVSGVKGRGKWNSSPAWGGRAGWSPGRGGWSPGERVDLSRDELRQIRTALEKHSEQIAGAIELSSRLWKQLSTTSAN